MKRFVGGSPLRCALLTLLLAGDAAAVCTVDITGHPNELSNDTTPTFTFTKTGQCPPGTFRCRLDGGNWTFNCTSPKNYSGISDDVHQFDVKWVDSLGSLVDQDSYTFVVETVPPDTSIVSGYAVGCSASPILEFASTEGGNSWDCKVDSGSWSACQNPHTFSGLADGKHTIEVKTTDQAGNVDPTPKKRDIIIDDGQLAETFEWLAGSPATLSTANQIFVDDDCLEVRNGSKSNPYCTLSAAMAQVTGPGKAVRIREGNYTDGGPVYYDKDGTFASPIWVGGYMEEGDEKPVFQGLDAGIAFDKSNYLIIHDLVVTGTTSHGINLSDGQPSYETDGSDPDYNYDNSRWVIIRDVVITSSGSGSVVSGNVDNCLKISGVNDFWVLDSTFSRCGMADPSVAAGDGIDAVGCHSGLIARNTFTTRKAVQIKGGSSDIEIRQNYSLYLDEGLQRAVYTLGQETAPQVFRPPFTTGATGSNPEARNVRLISNVIDGAGGAQSAVTYQSCVECLVANNTIVRPKEWVARVVHEFDDGNDEDRAMSRDGRFINNIVSWDSSISSSTQFQVGNGVTQGAAESFVLKNNHWYDSYQANNYNRALGTWLSESGSDIGGDSPGLTGTYYTIGTSSWSNGHGIRLGEVSVDRPAVCYDDPPSIGAFEASP